MATTVPNDVWGPAAWTFLHSASLAYPRIAGPEVRRHMDALLESLRHTLPCADCRAEWTALLARERGRRRGGDLPTEGARALQRFLVDAHNNVNRRLGKPQFTRARMVAALVDRPRRRAASARRAALLVVVVGAAAVLSAARYLGPVLWRVRDLPAVCARTAP